VNQFAWYEVHAIGLCLIGVITLDCGAIPPLYFARPKQKTNWRNSAAIPKKPQRRALGPEL
jgi:hypothetical protein